MMTKVSGSLDLIAVVDIGSNAVRLVVFQRSVDDDLRPISEVKSLLRIGRDTDASGHVSAEAVKRLVNTLRDFRRVADGMGAAQVIGVATSAIRNAVNGAEAMAEIRKATGFDFAILSGEDEAGYSFLGAVSGLPVNDGLSIDLGGGSLEVSHFADRRLTRSWTFRLGALHTSDLFLKSDPPSANQVAALRKHIHAELTAAEVPTLGARGRLVVTGGTVRNLAKIDWRAQRSSPNRLHGYVLNAHRLAAICRNLQVREADRRRIKGLNSERADSILGGALVLNAVVRYCGARKLIVAGHGLREGLVLAGGSDGLLPISEVKERAITGLGSCFATWRSQSAERRARIAVQISESLSEYLSATSLSLIGHAARLVDVGSSMNYYNRFAHAATIVDGASLSGFTQREEAFIAAILRFADGGKPAVKAYEPLLADHDGLQIARTGVLVALAEEVERRIPLGLPPLVYCRRSDAQWFLCAEGLEAWDPGMLRARFNDVFGLEAVSQGGVTA